MPSADAGAGRRASLALLARNWLPWSGAAAGLSIGAVLSGGAAGWLLGGAAVGAAGEVLARWIARTERRTLERVLAFSLAAQAVLGLLPAFAYGGFAAQAPAGGFRPSHLALAPLAALLMAGLRYGVLERQGGEERRAPRDADAKPARRQWLWTLAALALVAALGRADAQVPAPYSMDFLYLLPVLALTWTTGLGGGLVTALFSAEVHGIARGLTFSGTLPAGYSALESVLIVAGLGSGACLLAAVRGLLARESAAARTDLLTGLMNRKDFMERLESELSRSGRYARPLSLAYLDLDGFKGVNDRDGHAVGDQVLRIVAGVLRTSVREQDATARLGGDEFAVLLVETDADAARQVMERLRREVDDRMRAFEWPVTCSVGVVTSTSAGVTADELIRSADELMYGVKRAGKNALRQAVVGID